MGTEVIQRDPDISKPYPLGSAVAMEWSIWKRYPSFLSMGMGIY